MTDAIIRIVSNAVTVSPNGLPLPTQIVAIAAAAGQEAAQMATRDVATVIAAGVTVTQPVEIVGKPSDPVTGDSIGPAGNIFIGNRVLGVGGVRYVGRLRIFAKAAGDVGIVVYGRSGNTFRRRSELFTVTLKAGLNVLDAATGALPFIRVRAGETPAIFMPTTNGADLAATPGNPDDGAWFAQAGTPDSFTVGAAGPNFRLQWGFDIREAQVGSRQLLGRFLVQASSIAMVLALGQSNGGGADAKPALTLAPSKFHLTFGVGVKMTMPGLPLGTNPDDGQIKPLVEDERVPIAVGACGETHLSSFTRDFSRRRAASNPGLLQWFASYAGYPGAGIAGIDQTSAWYPNLTYHVTQARARAAALGLRLTVPIVTFDHGETDQGDGMSEAVYYGRTDAFFTAAAADITAITGQTFAPHFLFTTAPYGIKISSGPADALLRLARERDDVHFVAPGYRWPYANSVHLANVGQILKGCYYSRATTQLFDGRSPDCVEWLDAHSVGTKLYVTARAPYPLGWDGGETPAVVDYGIVVANGGTLQLSNMSWSVIGTDPDTGWPISQLEITTGFGSGGGQFRYAKDNQGAEMWGVGGQIANGASGNICDGTPEKVVIEGKTYSLAHFAPPVTLAIVELE